MKEHEAGSIVFYLEEGKLEKTADVSGVYTGRIKLSASVRDLGLWDQILASLDKMRLFKGEDLKTSLINLLQEKASGLEKQVATQAQEASQEIEVAKHVSSLAEAGRVRAEQKAQLLEAQVRDLEAKLQTAHDALHKWQDWYDTTVKRGLPG